MVYKTHINKSYYIFKSSKKLNHKFHLKKQFHELKNLDYIVLDNSKLFIDYRDKLNDEKFYFKFEKKV